MFSKMTPLKEDININPQTTIIPFSKNYYTNLIHFLAHDLLTKLVSFKILLQASQLLSTISS